MGAIYPAAPTQSEVDQIKLRRFLADPTAVNRRVNDLAANTFLTDFILPNTIETTGAVLYEISEGVYLDRDPEIVAPGAAYPRAKPTDGDAAFASVPKTGIDVPVTDEKLQESRRNEIDRASRQVGRHVRRVIDTRTITAALAAVTKTQAVIGQAWNGADPKLTRAWATIMAAVQDIAAEPEEYEADTVLLSLRVWPYAVEAFGVTALSDAQKADAVRTSQLPVVAGVTLAPARLPAGTDGIVLDRSVFGARAFRRIPSPEYVGSSETGIETWSRRDPVANDQWLIRGRRSMIGVIQEPRAARKLTGIYS